jgi:hypothetical protein
MLFVSALRLLSLLLLLASEFFAQEGIPLDAPKKQRDEDMAILAAASSGKLAELQQAICRHRRWCVTSLLQFDRSVYEEYKSVRNPSLASH